MSNEDLIVATAADRHADTMPVSFYDAAPADIYVPVNQPQVSDLTGKMLTVIDALGLPPAQSDAAKSLVRQHITGWFTSARDNSVTSYRGCVAPIQVLRHTHNGAERKYVWLAEGEHAVTVS